MVVVSPLVYFKLRKLMSKCSWEVGGFCHTEIEDGDILVKDVFFPKQLVSAASIEFDDESVAKLQSTLVDEAKLNPANFMRAWVHTHPGISATPSTVDWTTFNKIYGDCPWSLMLIMARGGEWSAHLSTRNSGLRTRQSLDVYVDWEMSLRGMEPVENALDTVFKQLIKEKDITTKGASRANGSSGTKLSPAAMLLGVKSTPHSLGFLRLFHARDSMALRPFIENGSLKVWDSSNKKVHYIGPADPNRTTIMDEKPVILWDDFLRENVNSHQLFMLHQAIQFAQQKNLKTDTSPIKMEDLKKPEPKPEPKPESKPGNLVVSTKGPRHGESYYRR